MGKTLNAYKISGVEFERNSVGFSMIVRYWWKSPRGKTEARRVILHFEGWYWLRTIGQGAWKLFEGWRSSVVEEIDNTHKALKGE